MKLLKELNLTDHKESLDIDVSDPLGVNAVKIYISGVGTNIPNSNQFLLRVNGQAAGYRSCVNQQGDSGNGEWGDPSGFYFGRGAWGTQANIFLEYSISAEKMPTMCLGIGRSVFWYPANGCIIGSLCSGSLTTNQPLNITSISMCILNGGFFTGTMKVYAL